MRQVHKDSQNMMPVFFSIEKNLSFINKSEAKELKKIENQTGNRHFLCKPSKYIDRTELLDAEASL